MKIIIEELNKDLIKPVQEFLFKQIRIEFGYGYVPEWHQDIVKIDEYYINPDNNNFFIAFNEKNEIIATIGIRAYDKDFPEFRNVYSNDKTSSIWRLFVDSRYRRYGIASRMFGIAESFAYESGYENIYLHTHKTLEGALEFWTKMGFVVTLDVNNDLGTVHMDKYIQSLEIDSQVYPFTHAVKL